MHSRLMSWSRYVYLAGIVLVLVLVIPTAWFPFQLAKTAVFALVLAVAGIMFVIGGGTRELLRAHGLSLALLVSLLPLSYLFSYLFSTNRAVGLVGVTVEVDTLVFVTLGALAFLFSFLFFRTLRMVRLLTTVAFWALAAAAAFQILVITGGTALIPFDIFADRSVNLIGKWNDLGLVGALLMILILVQAEMGHTTLVRRIVLSIAALVLIFVLAIINFTLAWAFILAASLVLGALKFLAMRKSPTDAAPRTLVQKVPWYAAVAAAVAVLCILFGSAFNTGLTQIVPVSSLEVRPSFTSTLDVINAAREGSIGRAFIGTGPNTFGESWLMHKPAEVNQSLFWNLDFNVGFSSLVTAFGSVGLIGMLAWLIPLALVLLGVMRVWRLAVLSREEKIAATAIVLTSIALLAAIIFYVPSSNLMLLAFVLAGAAFGFLWRQGQSGGNAEESMPASRIKNLVSIGTMSVLVILTVVVAFTVDRRFVAEFYTQQAQYAFGQGNVDEGFAHLERAQSIERDRNNTRLAVDAGNLKLQQLASDTTRPAAELQAEFASVLTRTIDAGRTAVIAYPRDYQQYVSLARVYDFLSTLNVEGAYESARQAYLEAEKQNPNNPEIPLLLARLEGAQGNLQLSSEHLTQALTLKPNYTDAILLVVQLSIADNDLATAIRAATAATQTAPGVAPIWFQLGLLYYAGGDTASAIAPLEQAIAIVPDYANAKYFLGLAYYAQNRAIDAQRQFQDLEQSNPDSEEVKLILSNIEAGKPPFEEAEPPITPNPETRPTAPLP